MTNIFTVKPDEDQLAYIHSHWRIDIATGIISSQNGRIGFLRSDGYYAATIALRMRQVGIHQVVWYIATSTWPSVQLDHFDRCKDHNWFSNLRLGDRALQAHNRDMAPGKYGYGVHMTNDSVTPAYEARIKLNGKACIIKRCQTPQVAESIYLAAREQLRLGATFANINALRQAIGV